MQTLASPRPKTAPSTLNELLHDYYEHFNSFHPSGGFWNTLEKFAQYLASRERFQGITAPAILARLRQDGVLVEVSVEHQRDSEASNRRVVLAETS